MREFLLEVLSCVDMSPKTWRSKGRRVAAAEVERPMPVSQADQIATSIVE
jgi:hypothetical protein